MVDTQARLDDSLKTPSLLFLRLDGARLRQLIDAPPSIGSEAALPDPATQVALVLARCRSDAEFDELARSLLQEGKRHDGRTGRAALPPSTARIFRREGELWTISFRGTVYRLNDMKGLRYMAYLLDHPRREFHAIDLTIRCADETECAASTILDRRKRAEYQRRLDDLRETVEEATAFNDFERAANAQREIESIADALATAFGLDSSDGNLTSAAERARLNVTRAIATAVKKIARNDRSLAWYLSSSIRTGLFCSYSPDPNTAGELTTVAAIAF